MSFLDARVPHCGARSCVRIAIRETLLIKVEGDADAHTCRIVIISMYDRMQIQMQTHTQQYIYIARARYTLLLHGCSKLHRASARGTRGIQRNALTGAGSDRANKVSGVITFRARYGVSAYCSSVQFAAKKSANGTMSSRYLHTRENATNGSNVCGRL